MRVGACVREREASSCQWHSSACVFLNATPGKQREKIETRGGLVASPLHMLHSVRFHRKPRLFAFSSFLPLYLPSPPLFSQFLPLYWVTWVGVTSPGDREATTLSAGHRNGAMDVCVRACVRVQREETCTVLKLAVCARLTGRTRLIHQSP